MQALKWNGDFQIATSQLYVNGDLEIAVPLFANRNSIESFFNNSTVFYIDPLVSAVVSFHLRGLEAAVGADGVDDVV